MYSEETSADDKFPYALQSLPNIEGIYVEFIASGESDPTDSPSELAIKVVRPTQDELLAKIALQQLQLLHDIA